MNKRKPGPNFNRAPGRKGLQYTERQLDILNDEIPLDEVPLHDLTNLMVKAKERGDDGYYIAARQMYEAKKSPTDYRPTLTVEEAKITLQALTPWKITWK